ncbi:hypothetical protein ABK040_001124 [Willaertia magna]
MNDINSSSLTSYESFEEDSIEYEQTGSSEITSIEHLIPSRIVVVEEVDDTDDEYDHHYQTSHFTMISSGVEDDQKNYNNSSRNSPQELLYEVEEEEEDDDEQEILIEEEDVESLEELNHQVMDRTDDFILTNSSSIIFRDQDSSTSSNTFNWSQPPALYFQGETDHFRFIPLFQLVQRWNEQTGEWQCIKTFTKPTFNKDETNNSSTSTCLMNNMDELSNSSHKRKRSSSIENTVETIELCPTKIQKTNYNYENLPHQLKLYILGFLNVSFKDCYLYDIGFQGYSNLRLNIPRVFGRFKNDPFKKTYLLFGSLELKVTETFGNELAIFKQTRELKLLANHRITNLNFTKGFTHLNRVSLWLTDSNFVNLVEKQEHLLPKIVYLNLSLFGELPECHYIESFAKMEKLQTLHMYSYLEGCKLTDGVKLNLPPKLKKLVISGFIEVDFKCFTHNSQIQRLSLIDTCSLKNVDQITSLCNLKRLKLNSDQTIDGQYLDLSPICRLSSLERLSLPEPVSFKYPLNQLTNLHTLRMYLWGDTTKEEIEQYANYILDCKSLRKIKFDMDGISTSVQNRFYDIISMHPNLQHVSISSTTTSSQLIDYFFGGNVDDNNSSNNNITRFPVLSELDLSLAEELSTDSFRHLLHNHRKTNLKRITLPMHLCETGVGECLQVLMPNIQFSAREEEVEEEDSFDYANNNGEDISDDDFLSVLSEEDRIEIFEEIETNSDVE